VPDVSLCRDHSCPSRGQCYRYTATPSKRQTYAEFGRAEGLEKCEAFVEVRVKGKEQNRGEV